MSKRGTTIAIYIFIIGSALQIPISGLMKTGPFTSTMYAGITLVMLYFLANIELLNAPHSDWKSKLQKGAKIPIALYLGALLMVIDFVLAVV